MFGRRGLMHEKAGSVILAEDEIPAARPLDQAACLAVNFLRRSAEAFS